MLPIRHVGALAGLLLAASASVHAAVASAGQVSRGEARLSPVTRVVEILQGLSKQIEQDGKKEEDLYETFVCWATSITNQKKEATAAAQARIDMLQTYIDDLAAGRIELTSERKDLQKEIETLRGDLEVAAELRTKEVSEYEDARAEMQQGIDALSQAIEVLKTATQAQPSDALLALRSQLGAGASSRAMENARLNLAVTLGQKALTKGDALFLERVLLGEVPTPDWKKLNRKATFKMSYESRAGGIETVLQKMLATFTSSLEESTKKEEQSKALYEEVKAAKSEALNSAEQALTRMDKETGARGLSTEEANEELAALRKQVEDDAKYTVEVSEALATKKTEWKARQELRAKELAAVSKAISILHGDGARDLFKRSYASQGFLFLQEVSSSSAQQATTALRRGRALEALRSAAARSSDRRLLSLISRLGALAGGHFDEVIAAVDSMLELLQKEEDKDLKIKETCEKDRSTDTREAIVSSRSIDEHSEAIVTLETKIGVLAKEITAKEEQVERIKAQLQAAKEEREQENAAYLVAKKDDEDAAVLVDQAKTTLEAFYSENGLVLAQRHTAPFQSQAGQAPPPPPSTWEGSYGGKTDESAGISAILGLIHEDLLADIADAVEEETAAAALYEKTKAALEKERDDLSTATGALTEAKSEAEGDVEDHRGERTGLQGELKVVMKKIEDAEPGCAYFQINYAGRAANRHIEIDGLRKAKAILAGGSFATPADPNRELKPGDALLQRIRRAS